LGHFKFQYKDVKTYRYKKMSTVRKVAPKSVLVKPAMPVEPVVAAAVAEPAAVAAEPVAVVDAADVAVAPAAKPKKSKKPKAEASSEVANAEVTSGNAAEVTSGDASNEVAVKTRNGPFIAVARTRRHLDKLNLNLEVEKLLAPFEKQLSEFKTTRATLTQSLETATGQSADELTKQIADVDAAAAECKTKHDALAKARVRMSSKSALVLSRVCDEVVSQLLVAAFNKCVADGKKRVVVECFTETASSIELWPLVNNLKVVKPATAPVVTVADATDDATDDVVAADADEHSMAFNSYIKHLYTHLMKSTEAHAHLKMSKEVKEYLNSVVVQFIQRIAPLAQHVAQCMKSKTVNEVSIVKAIEFLLIDGHHPVDVIETAADGTSSKVSSFPASGYAKIEEITKAVAESTDSATDSE